MEDGKSAKVRITWSDVDELEPSRTGHGVEIYYSADGNHDERILVAFVVGFDWWEEGKSVPTDFRRADMARVLLLRADSLKFADLSVSGDKVRAEVRRSVRKYVRQGKMFPQTGEHTPIGKHLTVWING